MVFGDNLVNKKILCPVPIESCKDNSAALDRTMSSHSQRHSAPHQQHTHTILANF